MLRVGRCNQARKQQSRFSPHCLFSAPRCRCAAGFSGAPCFAVAAVLRVAPHASQGMELGVADDQVFGRVDSKREGGSVGLLSGGLIDRTAYYEHAMTLALVPFMDCNKGLY
jgi:non-canonical (house-cleaning) NTP pyrophosphatase